MTTLLKTTMNARTLLLAAAVAAPLALNAGCDAVDADDTDDAGVQAEPAPGAADEDEAQAEAEAAELPLRDGEERFGAGVAAFHETELAGTRFRFLRIDSPDAGGRSVALLENQGPGGVSLTQEPAFAGASMLDMFLAITDEEVPLPEELLADVDHELGPRGWFADRAVDGEYPVARGACTPAEFQAGLQNWMPEINGTPVWESYTSPPEDGGWGPDSIEGCTGCNDWYEYRSGISEWPVVNADAVKTRIAICMLDFHSAIGNYPHYGPTVRFRYRTEGDVSAGILWSHDVAASETGTTHQLYWMGGVNPEPNNFDWKVNIDGARMGDSFSVGLIPDAYGW